MLTGTVHAPGQAAGAFAHAEGSEVLGPVLVAADRASARHEFGSGPAVAESVGIISEPMDGHGADITEEDLRNFLPDLE